MLTSTVAQAGARLREELSRACGDHLVEVRVFGSRVVGGAHPESDLDVFILLDTPDRALRTAAQHAAWDAALDLPFAISPLVMSTEHFQKLVDLERLIAKVILSEGIPV
jgi:predicted nucleotidyltransferase